MKLLYFTRQFGHHDRRFARLFASSGLDLCIVSREAPSAAYASSAVLPLGGAPAADLNEQIVRFRAVVERERPDLILAGPLTDCAYIVARAQPACRWIAQSWAFDLLWESERDPSAKTRASEALRSCNGLFADCAAIVGRSIDLAGRPELPAFIAPWGLDLDAMPASSAREAVRAERGWGARPVVLHTRGFAPMYGVEQLLAAWTELGAHPAKPLLVLAGDGAQRDTLQRHVAAGSSADSVAFLGRVDHAELLRLFRASDVYVSCARSDGTSVSLLEAMALGAVPVVADIGGTSEWVRHTFNGWLVRPSDSCALASGLRVAINLAPTEREKIAEWNWVICRDRADWSQNGYRLIKWLTTI